MQLASLHSLLILAKKATLTLLFVVKFKTMINPHQRIRAPVEEIEYPLSGGGRVGNARVVYLGLFVCPCT